MDLASQLLLFLDVTECGSFAGAAEFRGIDRSVVSKHIAKLEQDLGVRLLNRTTRSFSITGVGHEVLTKAREVKALLEDTQRIAINYHQQPQGTLRITCSSSLAQQLLQPVITQFQQRFPQVKIELYATDQVVDIVAEGYDMAFRIGELKDSSLIARYLARNRLILLATPTFLNTFGEPQTPEQLSRLPAACYVSRKFRADTVDYRDDFLGDQAVKQTCTFAANDIDMVKQHVLSGAAYYLAPAFQIHDEVKSGKLVPFMTHLKLFDYAAIYAVYPHRDLPIRTRLFFEAVKEYVGDSTPIWETNIPGFDSMYGNQSRQQWQPNRSTI